MPQARGPNSKSSEAQSYPARSIMERLRAKKDFDRVFAAGRRVQNSIAALVFIEREGDGVRMGFAVGRRFGGAVRRNRLKRRLREACRKELEANSTAGGWDAVCIPRMRAAETNFSGLVSGLRQLFIAAGIRQQSDRAAMNDA